MSAFAQVPAPPGRGPRRAPPGRVGNPTLAARAGFECLAGPSDPRYPPRLAAREPRPPPLWVRGDPARLAQALAVVTGSRHVPDPAMGLARSVGRIFALAGRAVVAGGSPGVEAAAMAGALAGGGGGRAVLVHPYPPERPAPGLGPEALRRLLDDGGALVSGLAPGSGETRGAHGLRSRIMAGLADQVVVVAAREGSGVLAVADAAGELGVPVRVLAGPARRAGGEGGAMLLAAGAEPVEDPLELVGLGGSARPPAVRVLEDAGPLSPDRLAARLGLGREAGEVLAGLQAEGWLAWLADGRLAADYRPLFRSLSRASTLQSGGASG